MVPERIHTGQNGEQVLSLNITGMKNGKIQSYDPKVVYSVRLTDITIGSLISVKAYGEVTNQLPPTYNVMVGCLVILASSATSTTAIVEITEAHGQNVTPEMHHGTFHHADDYVFTSDYSEVFVNVVLYAANWKAPANSRLIIEQDYGRLSVLLWRK